MQTASKKVINGWAMYDWSNSVYNLVITSTIFPAYYDAITGDGNDNTLIDKIKIGNFEFSNTSKKGVNPSSVKVIFTKRCIFIQKILK